MIEAPVNGGKRKIAIKAPVLLSLFTAAVVYMLARVYIKGIKTEFDDSICLGVTILFLGGIYIGRFLSQLWIYKNKNVPVWILVLLPLIITGGVFLCVFFASSFRSHPVLIYGLFLGFPLLILSLSLGMFVKLVRARIHKQLLDAQANAAHSQSELRLLQSQLSPHFLFNTLNNLYGLSITQHEKIPQLLLKLSELLRYSVYETRESLVRLQDELTYINNYIDFEKIRIGDRLVLTTDIGSIENVDFKIAPMLLIVFIENAFKHSKNSKDQRIFIEIALKIWDHAVLFSVKNSYSAAKQENELSGYSGMGLSNVKKRLELLYPNEYELNISENETLYSVMLRLKLG